MSARASCHLRTFESGCRAVLVAKDMGGFGVREHEGEHGRRPAAIARRDLLGILRRVDVCASHVHIDFVGGDAPVGVQVHAADYVEGPCPVRMSLIGRLRPRRPQGEILTFPGHFDEPLRAVSEFQFSPCRIVSSYAPPGGRQRRAFTSANTRSSIVAYEEI